MLYKVELFVKNDCLACEEALDLCREVAARVNESPDMRSIHKVDLKVNVLNPEEVNEYIDRVPVVLINGEEISAWGLSRCELEKFMPLGSL